MQNFSSIIDATTVLGQFELQLVLLNIFPWTKIRKSLAMVVQNIGQK